MSTFTYSSVILDSHRVHTYHCLSESSNGRAALKRYLIGFKGRALAVFLILGIWVLTMKCPHTCIVYCILVYVCCQLFDPAPYSRV